jgi:hypothetical protein
MDVSEFQAGNLALIQLAVDAFAKRPTLTEAQQKTRAEAVVRAVAGFLPFEPVQTILAIEAVGHHLALLDTFRDLGSGNLSDAQTMRARTATMGQTRSFLSVVKELRTVRQERLALYRAEEAATRSQAARDGQAAESDPAAAVPANGETAGASTASGERAGAPSVRPDAGPDAGPTGRSSSDPGPRARAFATGAGPSAGGSGLPPPQHDPGPSSRQAARRPMFAGTQGAAAALAVAQSPAGQNDAVFEQHSAELAASIEAAMESLREATGSTGRGPAARDAWAPRGGEADAPRTTGARPAAEPPATEHANALAIAS